MDKKSLEPYDKKIIILETNMKDEEIVLLIIRQTGLSRKEIYEMTEEKKKKFSGLISDSLALSQVIKDLCIRI